MKWYAQGHNAKQWESQEYYLGLQDLSPEVIKNYNSILIYFLHLCLRWFEIDKSISVKTMQLLTSF